MNNLRILRTKNTKFSGYYFYLDTNIWGDFQICSTFKYLHYLWSHYSKVSKIYGRIFLNDLESTNAKAVCMKIATCIIFLMLCWYYQISIMSCTWSTKMSYVKNFIGVIRTLYVFQKFYMCIYFIFICFIILYFIYIKNILLVVLYQMKIWKFCKN